MIDKMSVEDVDVRGKRVLLRVDFNVPLDQGRVADDTRIRAALPTIRFLLERRARLVIATHLGRPKGGVVEELRLDPVAARLSELLGQPVRKLDQVVGEQVRQEIEAAGEGTPILLENVRFEEGEERNDPGLSGCLAGLADLFVNDAFGAAHRAHATTAGVAAYIPAVAGLLMKKEIEVLSSCLENPGRPLMVLLGGAKISDKIGVVRRFLELADTLLIGGGMANTFLAAQGYQMGGSLYEEAMLSTAASLLEASRGSRCRVFLPQDLVVAEKLEPGAEYRVVGPAEIGGAWKAVDIGPETARLYCRELSSAGMIIWNGPLGVCEIEPFHLGTEAVARAVASSEAYSVVGGGDLVAAIEKIGLAGRISFISTGGGATLEFWEGKQLPGIAVLQDRESESLSNN